MGLPVWRAPSPIESKDAIKVDLNASARSPIRRRVRSPRRARRSESIDYRIRAPLQRSPRLTDNDFEEAIATLGAATWDTVSNPRLHQRPRIAPPPVPESRNYSRNHEHDRALVQAAFRDDTLSLRSSSSERLPRVPPPRSTRAFGELPAYTPNFAPAGYTRQRQTTLDEFSIDGSANANGSGQQRRLLSSSRPRSRVPGVPAGVDYRIYRPTSDLVIVEDSDDSSDNNAVAGFPPLRRMGRRTIADGPLPSSSLRESWSPGPPIIDGLGDRDRSPSPVDGHWDNLLSTVAPDPLAPTAESSFTSAAASASFSNSHPASRSGSSNSNSASSSRTHLTVPSESELANRAFAHVCDTSDDDSTNWPTTPWGHTDSDGDTEPEDTDAQVINRLRPRSSTSRPADGPPPRNPFRYPRAVRDRSRESSRFVRNYYSFTSRTGERTEPRPSSFTADPTAAPEDDSSDLEQMRSILERLARRDDIPADFWTSAGLAPPLAERVDRVQRERERL